MIDFIKKSIAAAFAVITGIFTFVPESVFAGRGWITQGLLSKCEWLSGFEATDVNVVITRLVCFLLVWIATSAAYALFLALRRWTTIRGENYSIRVEYGNILKKRNCKRVINFDECFTTHVGDKTADINPTSICGQYLTTHQGLDMQKLIDAANITPARAKSQYQQKTKYDSGTIVPNGDDLLMAFAKLDD